MRDPLPEARRRADVTRPLVVGVGRAECGDDAVGTLVALEVAGRLGARVEVRSVGGDLTREIEDWQGRPLLVLIDAMHSGAPPGTVRRFDANAACLPDLGEPATSTHGLGLGPVLELARLLGYLPARLVVVAIEGRRFTVGTLPSPEVLSAVGAAVALVESEVEGAFIFTPPAR